MSEAAKKDYDDVLIRIFEETQAELPEYERAAPKGIPFCGMKDDGYTCTIFKGHTGDHCSHGKLGAIHHRWRD